MRSELRDLSVELAGFVMNIGVNSVFQWWIWVVVDDEIRAYKDSVKWLLDVIVHTVLGNFVIWIVDLCFDWIWKKFNRCSWSSYCFCVFSLGLNRNWEMKKEELGFADCVLRLSEIDQSPLLLQCNKCTFYNAKIRVMTDEYQCQKYPQIGSDKSASTTQKIGDQVSHWPMTDWHWTN